MDVHRHIPQERTDAHLVAGIQVQIADLEGVHGDVAVLAGKIAHLACFRLGIVAWGDLAPDVGVDVAEGLGAVPGGRDGEGVDVIDERAERHVREPVEVDVEDDAGAVGVARGGYVTADVCGVACSGQCVSGGRE